MSENLQKEPQSPGWWSPTVPFSPANWPFFYGWTIVGAATLITIFSIPGQTMGFSVFTDLMMAELGLSRVALSLAYCVGTVASGFTLPRLGRLFDRWGERRMAVMSSAATGLVLCGFAGLGPLLDRVAFARSTIAFVAVTIAFYLIRASAQGVMTLAGRNAIGRWFNHRRGIATAVSGVLTAFAFSVAPKYLDRLIVTFGHRGAWAILGLAMITVMAPLSWLLFRDDPESVNLAMDGDTGGPRGAINPDMTIHRESTRDEALRTYSFWIFNFSFAFYALYATAFTFHIVSLGAEFSFSKTRILGLFPAIAVVSVSTNLLFGWLSAHTRLKWLLVIENLGGVLAAVGLLCLNRPGGVIAYVLGNGMASGGFICLSGIFLPRFFGRLHLGAIGGVNMACMVIASGIGPLLFGACLHFTGSYVAILSISVAIPAVLALLSLKADNPQRMENDEMPKNTRLPNEIRRPKSQSRPRTERIRPSRFDIP